MLAAENPQIADGLLLLSYPLHPPNRPDSARTAHFPSLRIPAFFAHGTRDPFASSDELEAAAKLIRARTSILHFDGAGHDLVAGAKADRASRIREIAIKAADALTTKPE